jgi:DNA-binding CsgD family transcriptional regulator
MTIQLETPDFLANVTTPLPCASNADLFHPDGDDDSQARDDDIRLARALCSRCPALLACRTWGRARRESGIWGGETEEERAALGYARKPQPGDQRPECGTEAGAKWHRRYGTGTPCPSCAYAERQANLQRRRERDQQARHQWPPHLAPKEQAVLEAFAEGLELKQIAKRLGIARKSIDSRLYTLRVKLRTDTDGLVAVGRELGLIKQPRTELASAA